MSSSERVVSVSFKTRTAVTLVTVFVLLLGMASARTTQSESTVRAAVSESRTRLAQLDQPLPSVTLPRCPTPAPKGEFETTAAFDARLAAAEVACSAERRRYAADLQRTESLSRERRSALTKEAFVLPLWEVSAEYDADRAAFMVDLGNGRATLGAAIDKPMIVRIPGGRKYSVCVVPVGLEQAPLWRQQTELFLRFRLDGETASVGEQVLLMAQVETGRVSELALSECMTEKPVAFHGVALRNVMGAEEEAERRWQERMRQLGAVTQGELRNVQDPVLIQKVEPKYTPEAMEAKIQGIVELEAVITAAGTVSEIRVYKSLDRTFGLDEEAVRVARQWRFRPARQGGKPVPMLVILQLEFRLH